MTSERTAEGREQDGRVREREARRRLAEMMDRAARHDVEVVHIAGVGDVVVELPPMGGEEWDWQTG